MNNELWFNKPPGGGGYAIERSLRFNSADSAYLSRTPGSAGNRKTWTWAGWVKRSGFGTYQRILSTGDTSLTKGFYFDLVSSDGITLFDYTSSVPVWVLATTQVFRDPGAWYHLQITYDTTQAVSSNRVKLYVNGTQVTTFSTASYPSLNYEGYWNGAVSGSTLHAIGRDGSSSSSYFNGYLADIHFIDGQALDPTSFGEFDDNGIWQPKAYTGSYGTNGFHLDFSDNSTAAALGTDTSGNGNNWTVNNISTLEGNGNYIVGMSAGGGAAFDGNESTYTYAIANTNAASITFNFNPPLQVQSLLEVRLFSNQGSSFPTITSYYDIGSGQQICNDFTATGGVGWQPIIASGSLSAVTISSYFQGTQNLLPIIYAFRKDGVLLVDNVYSQNNDSLVDVPTNGNEVDTGLGNQVRGNYCTWNPLANTAVTLSNGNLDGLTIASNAFTRCNSTISVSSGKWYFEVLLNVAGTNTAVGIGQNQITSQYPGQDALSYVQELDNARKGNNDTFSSYGSTLAAGDVFMCAFDLDNNKIFFGKNGTWFSSSDPAAGTNPAYTLTSGTYCPITRPYGNLSGSISANFGARSFAYTAPSGFKALNTANLPAPVVTKPSTVMDVKLYTGNGSTQAISGLGFSTDFAWLKKRNGATSHRLFDTVRGATKNLYSNTTDAEGTDATTLSSFDSTGFSLGDNGAVNALNDTYVAWCWDAGSSTVTNTDGSISSQVRANASAGFSIVTYTGVGSTGTVGHGLGVAPSFYIVKARTTTAANSWRVYHASLGATKQLFLEDTAAESTNSSAWNNTAPTSTVFSVGSLANESSGNYVAYCFAPVAGYSSFGSYTGNGSTDGPFVYTGFRPRWIMVKRSDSTGNWTIKDTSRPGYNVTNLNLFSNLSTAETTEYPVDLLSNGFKVREGTFSDWNANGGTYVWAAFAEHPFQYARAR